MSHAAILDAVTSIKIWRVKGAITWSGTCSAPDPKIKGSGRQG